MIKIPNETIFAILRILKKFNPGDTYYENYLWHLKKRGDKFFDIYHFAWSWVIEHHPANIFEIGTRTGLSLAQLLSAYLDYSCINKIVSCDLFNDSFISSNLVKMNLDYIGIPQDVINKITFLTGDSKQTVVAYKQEHPNEKFDYILVDGSHDKNDAAIDLENVFSLVNKGGVIVFDDITPDGMNLMNVWHDFQKKYQNEFEWNENHDGKGLGWGIKI